MAILLPLLFITFVRLHRFIVIASRVFLLFSSTFPVLPSSANTYLLNIFFSKSYCPALLPFSTQLVRLFPNPNLFTLLYCILLFNQRLLLGLSRSRFDRRHSRLLDFQSRLFFLFHTLVLCFHMEVLLSFLLTYPIDTLE